MSPLFDVLNKDGETGARRGRLRTAHGVIDTPVFMPVGSHGSVKGLTARDLEETGARMILGNAYHLFLRPGHERVRDAGGLHRFTGWSGSMLTDSGGFQLFSLAALARLDDEGVEFRSHIDGSLHRLDPERMVAVQEALGADVIMALDDCPGLPAPRARIEASVRRTVNWARRSLEVHRRSDQALFAIVQGGLDAAWRDRCLEALLAMPFPGYAIGGLSVGEDRDDTSRTAAAVAAALPDDKPRYLMGVGRPDELVEMVAAGIDMFDCVMPTRNGRNGTLFTSAGTLNIKRTEFRTDDRPVEEGCPCFGCRRHSRAYLSHLFHSKELLSYHLNSLHNLVFYQQLMDGIRNSLENNTFSSFRKNFHDRGLQAALTV